LRPFRAVESTLALPGYESIIPRFTPIIAACVRSFAPAWRESASPAHQL